MSDLHSSALPPGSPLPKTVLGKTRNDEKRERTTAETRNLREVYRLVDTRDQGRCRICGRRVVANAVTSVERAEHHHIVKRSQGGPDTTANILLVCVSRCHDDIHVRALVKLSGDADLKDERGRFAGVRVERWMDGAGWTVTGWV